MTEKHWTLQMKPIDRRSHFRLHESISISRAALYMRVSTGRQAEHYLSIPDQRSQLNSWCRTKAIPSWRSSSRPAPPLAMIDDLYSNK
jgi:hypothetical protein